jgi:hypothetical protein
MPAGLATQRDLQPHRALGAQIQRQTAGAAGQRHGEAPRQMASAFADAPLWGLEWPGGSGGTSPQSASGSGSVATETTSSRAAPVCRRPAAALASS